MSVPDLTTSEVADLFAVHSSTVKRWCDERILTAQRTSGGHRRFRLDDVLAVAAERGISTFISDFEGMEESVWRAVSSVRGQANFAPFVHACLAGLAQEDPRGIGILLRTLLLRADPSLETVVDKGVVELMEEVGARWGDGRISVGQEHLITQIVREALMVTVDPLKRPEAGAPRAIVCTGDTSLHELGALAVRLTLTWRGWNTTYLGTRVPAHDLADMSRRLQARLICVSFSGPMQSPDVSRFVRALAVELGDSESCHLAIGGSPTADWQVRQTPDPFRSLNAFQDVFSFGEWLDEEGWRSA